MENFSIVASDHYVPSRIVTNDELSHMMTTSDEWITSRTGIRQRHVVMDEGTTDLAVRVAEGLLTKAQWSADDLDFIIVGTMSPDTLMPSVAAAVQGRIGANKAFAFDLSAACSGLVFSLSMAASLLSNRYRRGLVIGTETLSRLVDWTDRTTAVLFGDGAAGFLVQATQDPVGLMGEQLATFGSEGKALTAGQLGSQSAFTEPTATELSFSMNGRQVYNFATRQVPDAIQSALKRSGLTLQDVDVFLLHQANARIIQSIAKHLKQPLEKFPINVGDYGNTSAASIGILYSELAKQDVLHPGQTIVLAGFGGGLTAGALVVRI
ncbi:beta-ketoacyl-ACP synthase III [Weissella halotolerans]|uniref:Beta-ketoacyl-[acyl-carrier-protein] synthase III n=1 Tax=Weissella halotolerans DSM 20190 TaxID=1123500 RepID=A0A0R2G7W9_9LACO|nr:beta-ketoacyl-ACP synthase III [Weissella halotolerans]KRN33258.1 3-oxoacyl-[acyl-carrier-protein] synthase III [Weissella halotolerans DSM 20190]